MIFKLFCDLFPICVAGLIAYLTYCLSLTLRNGQAGSLCDLCLLPEKTPAFEAFIAFVIETASAVTAAVNAFGHVSNHIVISLEIVYLFSILMLIVFHNLKESGSLFVKRVLY